ncbi:hypothetical protein B9G69_003035 [Bdellovibrio sp. SKB1291214]|uniref:hypothetical protein n=1 Tax=Bdellovibrio sp. SKB1291214 TaxID=1732569 RepID=UPI00223FE698|nr:hypothetical protein [Bdellovibrio sp. SKB1291214]UYL09545.1 hypothetical protein B9G69_003035 [Bdellovibrio sp. SKB1291214]
MIKFKLTVISLAVALVAALFPTRYLAPNSGVNTTSGDYGTHMNISQHIMDFELFPSLHQDNVGIHATSKYLPVYHGILGFHLITTLLEWIGIPRPGAYALTMDVCLIAIFLSFLFYIIDNRTTGTIPDKIFATLMIFPMFYGYYTEAVNSGFFSQLASQAFLVVGGYLFTTRLRKWAPLFILYAFFCYPDCLIWFIPAIIFYFRRSKLMWVTLALIPIWLVVLWVPFSRATLTGPFIASMTPWLATCAFSILFGFNIWRHNKNVAVITIFFTLYTVIFTTVTMTYLNPSYYATKISSFSYILLPFLLIDIPVFQTFRGKLLLLTTTFFVAGSPNAVPVESMNYLKNHSAFTNHDYKLIRNMKEELSTKMLICSPQNTYPLPQQIDPNIVPLAAAYGNLMNYDIYSLEVNSKGMQTMFGGNERTGSFGVLLDYLSNNSLGAALEFMENKMSLRDISLDFCLAVPKESSSVFAKSQYFEKLYEGAQFVYFKPQKP